MAVVQGAAGFGLVLKGGDMRNFFNFFRKTVDVEAVKVVDLANDMPVVTTTDMIEAIKMARTIWPLPAICITLELWSHRPGEIKIRPQLYVEDIVRGGTDFETWGAMLTFIRNYK